MEQANLLALFWEGFEPVQHTHVDSQAMTIRLQAKAAPVPVCSHCGRQVSQIHDVHWRRVRERDLFSYRVWLEVPGRRLRCPGCGSSRDLLPGPPRLVMAVRAPPLGLASSGSGPRSASRSRPSRWT